MDTQCKLSIQTSQRNLEKEEKGGGKDQDKVVVCCGCFLDLVADWWVTSLCFGPLDMKPEKSTLHLQMAASAKDQLPLMFLSTWPPVDCWPCCSGRKRCRKRGCICVFASAGVKNAILYSDAQSCMCFVFFSVILKWGCASEICQDVHRNISIRWLRLFHIIADVATYHQSWWATMGTGLHWFAPLASLATANFRSSQFIYRYHAWKPLTPANECSTRIPSIYISWNVNSWLWHRKVDRCEHHVTSKPFRARLPESIMSHDCHGDDEEDVEKSPEEIQLEARLAWWSCVYWRWTKTRVVCSMFFFNLFLYLYSLRFFFRGA